MVASVSAAQWQHNQDALRDEVRRVTTLMRSINDPELPAIGQWNIAEVAMHLSQNWILVPALARTDLSRYKAVVPGIVEVAGDSMIPDMWDNADMNALALASDTERDLVVLADRIEECAQEYLDECAGHSPDEPRAWIVEGTTVPLSALTCNLLNETLMHGYDIAHATGRKWRIEQTHAAMVVQQFFVPMLQTNDPRTFVNAEKAAGLQATYGLHLRGGGLLNFIFDNGLLRVWVTQGRRAVVPASRLPYLGRSRSILHGVLAAPEPVERDHQGPARGLGPQAVAGVEVQVPDPQPLRSATPDRPASGHEFAQPWCRRVRHHGCRWRNGQLWCCARRHHVSDADADPREGAVAPLILIGAAGAHDS